MQLTIEYTHAKSTGETRLADAESKYLPSIRDKPSTTLVFWTTITGTM